MIKNISNLGDAAIYCDFGPEVNETINTNVIDYYYHLSNLVVEKKIEGIKNITPSYNKLIVSFNLSITNFSGVPVKTTSPPLSPPYGPKSIIWSEDLIKSMLCSTTIIE